MHKSTNVPLKICSIAGQILFDSEPLEAEPVEEINPESPYSGTLSAEAVCGGLMLREMRVLGTHQDLAHKPNL